MTPEQQKKFDELMKASNKLTFEETIKNFEKSQNKNYERLRAIQDEGELKDIANIRKKRGRPKKVKEEELKSINIMKGRADLIGNRVEVETKVKKGLKNNEKKALKHAVIEDLDKKIKMTGRSIRRIYLSDTESDSDSEKEEELKKVYKHLKSHMKDKKEKRDPRDEKQAKEIKKILSRK